MKNVDVHVTKNELSLRKDASKKFKKCPILRPYVLLLALRLENFEHNGVTLFLSQKSPNYALQPIKNHQGCTQYHQP